MHIRTTLIIDENLLEPASQLTGIRQKTALVHASLEALIAHFRKGAPRPGALLREGLVPVHPFVVDELGCGNLRNRARILTDRNTLSFAVSATREEVMRMIEDRWLWGLGIGWIEAHLLAASLLSNCQLWTLDRRLLGAADDAAVWLYQPTYCFLRGGWSSG